MLIQNMDMKSYTGGPFDILCILRDVDTGRYHVCFFEEHPVPYQDLETRCVRLKSKMHHTIGAATFDEAKDHMKEMREKIILCDNNVSIKPIGWDGQTRLVWLVDDWHEKGCGVEDVLGSVGVPLPDLSPIKVEQIFDPILELSAPDDKGRTNGQ